MTVGLVPVRTAHARSCDRLGTKDEGGHSPKKVFYRPANYKLRMILGYYSNIFFQLSMCKNNKKNSICWCSVGRGPTCCGWGTIGVSYKVCVYGGTHYGNL